MSPSGYPLPAHWVAADTRAEAAVERAENAERRLTELQTAVKEVASGDWDRDYMLSTLRAALAGSAVEETTDVAPASGRGEEA